MDDEEYKSILGNLIDYSNRYIFIYTWVVEPENYIQSYQKYRDFKKYIPLFESNGFKLVDVKKPFSFIEKYGAMWIFKKENK